MSHGTDQRHDPEPEEAQKPAYLAIAERLAEQIAQWPTGTRVPSEPEIASAEGISRLTARAAVQELERRHLVRRRRGAGTFVVKLIDYSITSELVPSWSASVKAQGAFPTSLTELLEERPAPAAIAAALGVPPLAPVMLLSRLRHVNGELAACADSYLPSDLVPDLAERLAPDGSLFAILDDHYDLDPVRGWTRLGLDVAPEHITSRLRLRGRPQLIMLQSRTDSRKTGRPIDLTHSWLRPEVFRVSVEMGTPPPTAG